MFIAFASNSKSKNKNKLRQKVKSITMQTDKKFYYNKNKFNFLYNCYNQNTDFYINTYFLYYIYFAYFTNDINKHIFLLIVI